MAKYITKKEVLSDCEKLLYTKVIREVNVLKPSGVYYPIKIYDYAVTYEDIQVPIEEGFETKTIEKKESNKRKRHQLSRYRYGCIGFYVFSAMSY